MRDDRNGKNSGDVRERIEEREESGVERTSRQRGERVGSLFAPTSLTEARASRLKEIGRSAAKKKNRKKKKWKKDKPWGERKRRPSRDGQVVFQLSRLTIGSKI